MYFVWLCPPAPPPPPEFFYQQAEAKKAGLDSVKRYCRRSIDRTIFRGNESRVRTHYDSGGIYFRENEQTLPHNQSICRGDFRGNMSRRGQKNRMKALGPSHTLVGKPVRVDKIIVSSTPQPSTTIRHGDTDIFKIRVLTKRHRALMQYESHDDSNSHDSHASSSHWRTSTDSVIPPMSPGSEDAGRPEPPGRR